MKAIVYYEYGSPDVLRLEDVEKPVPGANEILVEIRAASINSYDWDLLRGVPFLTRVIGAGLRKPRNTILGTDIAGRVEAVGNDVSRFKTGDEVFGELSQRSISIGWVGFAEYVCARESSMLLKPASLSFQQAAAIPQVGALALGGLRHNGGVKPGQKVLINGAGGGVGTFAVQIARSFGAEVTGVDSTEKLEMLHSIGADHVIDFTKEDFTRSNQRYDLIVDVAAYHSLFRYRRALAPGGAYGVTGGSRVRFFRTVFAGPLISKFGTRKLGTVGAKPNEDLELLLELIEANKVTPVIDRTYPLSEVPDAFRYFGEGHVKGKVVISMKGAH